MFILKSIKIRRIFIAVVFSNMLGSLVFLGMRNQALNDYPVQNDNEIYKDNNRTKTILLGTIYHSDPNWDIGGTTVNHSFFEKNQCPHTNCVITTNRSYVPAIDLFDAIVFDSGRFFLNSTLPSARSAKQLYVFANNESPVHTQHFLRPEKGFYNLTMTYRIDSDVVWYYGLIRDIETKELVAPAFKPPWKTPPDNFTPDGALNKTIEGKTKKAAWFVSHCGAGSKRDNLTRGIQTDFDLDIYGDCGNIVCPRNRVAYCYDKLDTDYKFYFAFENTLCKDYVTEKLYYALERAILPVVYGGADYNRFAPPQSYINAEDFPTTSALLKYLKYVDSNQAEYNKYFWWKKHYEVAYEPPFCQLCTILNTPSPKENRIYNNIWEWWWLKQCRTPNILFD